MIYDRRPKSTIGLADIPPLAYGAAAVVLVLMIGLWLVTRPSDAKARLAALETQAASIQVAAAADGDLATYPLGSVCSSTLDEAFRNQLTSALINSGLKVEALDIRNAGKVEGRHPLTSYALTLKASGTYEQAINSLEIMAHYRPRLFLDSLSLKNQTRSVDLNVEGRLFCRWTR